MPATLRVPAPSLVKIPADAGAFLRIAWTATTPVSPRAMRSENFVKMPPMGVSSPAPTSIRRRPPSTRKIPPGVPRPSMTAANATAPRLLRAGAPKAAKLPPAGAGSP